MPQQPELTRRQAEILILICEGKSDKQIASELGIAYATIGYHVAQIFKKLDAENRASAIYRWAVLHGDVVKSKDLK